MARHRASNKAAKAAKAAGDATGAGKRHTADKRATAIESAVAAVPFSSPVRSVGDDLPDELICGICYDLLASATQTPCCGALSCKECVETVAAQTSLCPFCRADELYADRLLRDVRVERAAASFVRPCKYDGCDYRGKRDKLKAHIAACPRRPPAEIIAELREAEMRWRRQRCWQLSSIIKFYEGAWTDATRVQLEQLQCRIHTFDGRCCNTVEPRMDDSVPQPAVAPLDSMLPRTRVRLYVAAGVPYLRISHLEDQKEPTWCYVILPLAPSSARKIAIPASKAEAIVVRDFLPKPKCEGANDVDCKCGACDREGQDGDGEDFCACGLDLYLAKTLGDFGLTEDREYAHAGIDAY